MPPLALLPPLMVVVAVVAVAVVVAVVVAVALVVVPTAAAIVRVPRPVVVLAALVGCLAMWLAALALAAAVLHSGPLEAQPRQPLQRYRPEGPLL